MNRRPRHLCLLALIAALPWLTACNTVTVREKIDNKRHQSASLIGIREARLTADQTLYIAFDAELRQRDKEAPPDVRPVLAIVGPNPEPRKVAPSPVRRPGIMPPEAESGVEVPVVDWSRERVDAFKTGEERAIVFKSRGAYTAYLRTSTRPREYTIQDHYRYPVRYPTELALLYIPAVAVDAVTLPLQILAFAAVILIIY